MTLDLWATETIRPYEYNLRLNGIAVAAVAWSLREFGLSPSLRRAE